MLNEEQSDFLRLNHRLVQEIQRALDNSSKLHLDELWKNPSVVREIFLPSLFQLVKTYENDIELLARFQLGLLKHMDFFYFEWAKQSDFESIYQIAFQITEMAASLANLQKRIVPPIVKCGCHDNACYRMSYIQGYSGGDCNHFEINYGRWPTIPGDMVKNFLGKPKAMPLKNVRLYRILPSYGNPYGEWWFCNLSFQDRAMWRTGLAVTERMNLNNCYIDFYVEDKPLLVWGGPAASQQAGPQCILPGGSKQIWIARKLLENFKLPRAQLIQWPLP